MNVVTAFAPSLVAAVAVFVVAWLSKGRFDAMDARFDTVDGQFREVRDDIRQIRSELAGLRSHLTHVALAVGAKAQPEAG